MITKHQGSSILVNYSLIPEAGTSFILEGAEFVVSITTHTYEDLFTITPVIDGTKLFAEVTPLQTSTMFGKYIYEIKVKDATGRIDTIKSDMFEILKSNNPTWGISGGN